MALLVAGIAASYAVDYTAKAFITMDGKQLKLREASTLSEALDGGADIANANPDQGVFAVANISGQTNTQWTQFGTDDLEGLQVAFKPSAASVTFAFSSVSGADLYLVDAADNSRNKIVESEPYTFTVAADKVGTVVADRFTISKIGKPGPIFNNDKLTILGFAGKKVKVDDAKGGVVVAEKTLASDNEEINLSDKSAGRYVVTLDGKEYQIDVKVKDIPEAKYHIVTP